jgi:hypothetical protein
LGAACGSKSGSTFDGKGPGASVASSVGPAVGTSQGNTINPAIVDDSGVLGDAATSTEPTSKIAGKVYSDFSIGPVLDATDAGTAAAPANAATLFGPATQGATSGGPCLVEPEIGALYPDNWLRPRFRWVAASGENLFELRLHVANQANDLVVYTTSNAWTMPEALWDLLRADSYDESMTLTIRGGVLAGGALTDEALGSSGGIGIAPVDAPGTIVYWTPSPNPALKGFAIGDESVTPALTPNQVQQFSTNCIGCHNSTPDGEYASFSSSFGNWCNGIASVAPPKTGAAPPWLGAAANTFLEVGALGIHTFSKAHWTTGDRVEVTAYNPQDNTDSELAWVDLEAASAPAMGILARTGDPAHAGAPSWSHDGTTIAYTSTDANRDGRLDVGDADVYLVPYNNRAGGTATPLDGANDPNASDYYPAFSPDDRFVAFNKAASGSMYSNPLAEVWVVSSAGGTPVRLNANDPPACIHHPSPGVTNSWPKWAPSAATTADGRTFYWVVFSSTRDPYTPDAYGDPQLYLTAYVVDSKGNATTYGSLYFWNQPETEHNHTPAWDYFMIPTSPPPPP